MDQSLSDLKSNTSKPELSEAPDSGASTLDDFWYTFRIFAFRFEKFVFDHGYVFPIFIYLSFLILDGTIDHRLVELLCSKGCSAKLQPPPTDYPHVMVDLTSRIFLVSGGLFALILWLFNKWRQSIPRTFRELLSRGCINSKQGGDVNKEYQCFLEEYQKTLLSKKRYIFSFILSLIYAGLCFVELRSIIFPQGSKDPILQTTEWIIAFIRVIVIALLLGYFAGIGLWAIATSSVYIKNLTSRFKLTIVLNHPDHCGGLQSLGNFCLYMALPILVGAVFFGIYGIGDTLLLGQLAQILNGQPTLNAPSSLHPANQNQIVTITVVLIVFALLLAGIIFFLSLSNIHREMVIEKQAYDDEFAELHAKLDKKIRSSLDKGELQAAIDAKQEMEILQGLYPDKINFPTWPFNYSMVFTFVTVQIPAVLSLVGLVTGFFPKKLS